MMKVERILATKGSGVVTVRAEQTIREAVALLRKHNIGAVVVVDASRKPVGILSERDVVRSAAEDEALFGKPVELFMTTDVVTGLPHDDVRCVARTMTKKRFRHLPIVDGGELIGIVSIGDIVKAEREEFEGEIDTLETMV